MQHWQVDKSIWRSKLDQRLCNIILQKTMALDVIANVVKGVLL